MTDTAGRLLRLLPLLTARPSWRGDELAVRLGVTARTVRRDIDRLRELGYPVRAIPGRQGTWPCWTSRSPRSSRPGCATAAPCWPAAFVRPLTATHPGTKPPAPIHPGTKPPGDRAARPHPAEEHADD